MTIPPDKSDPSSAAQPVKPQGLGPPTQPPAAPGFESYMKGAPSPAQGGAPAPGTMAAGPAQVQPGIPGQAGGPTIDSVLSQVSTSQDSLNNLKNQVNSQNLRLKRSQSHLLRNKLSDASGYLRAVNGKLGVETPPMPSSGDGPLAKFVNFINDGQNQLMAARDKLSDLKNAGDTLRPADLLLVQVKMGLAQQEIEYSSTLLGKVIDAIKTTLNTQL